MTAGAGTRSVPFFNYQQAFASQESAFVDVFRNVLRRGAFILQDDLAKFESRLADYVGVKHAIGVGNATDGLTMALRAAEVGPGHEVIFPSHTMVASPAAVHFVGAQPIPVDFDDDHMIDPKEIERAITSRTKAILPVHLNGRTARMDAVMDLAERYGLIVVEDAAQALGSKFQGRHAGSFGVAAAFSFYPAKILGCLGDGGAVVTDDDEIAVCVRRLRDHGRADNGEVMMWGGNSRLDNLQAALLDLQLRSYQNIIDRRRQLARSYHERLNELSQLMLPPPPDEDSEHFDTFQNYEFEAENRDALRAFLGERGVGTLVQWGGKAVHQFAGLGFNVSLPRTERFFERCLMLPLNMAISDEDVGYVCEMIREFYR